MQASGYIVLLVLVVHRGRVGGRPPRFLLLGSSQVSPFFVYVYGTAPGHLWPGAEPALTALFGFIRRMSPRSREANSNLWDCKVTPAYCTCQEGNTTCCISSNDGRGAAVADRFSTSGIHLAFTEVDRGVLGLTVESEWWKAGGRGQAKKPVASLRKWLDRADLPGTAGPGFHIPPLRGWS
jgi:hypothetical protein